MAAASRWTPNELSRIKGSFPEFKALGVKPSLDSIVVAFLQKYEVYVSPASTANRRRGGDVASDAFFGAISGATGNHEYSADAAIISNQKKGAAIQEWTQWKQWALDHKDFEAFRAAFMGKWENLSERLESDEFAEEWAAKAESFAKEAKKREKALTDNFLRIALPILIGSLTLSVLFSVAGNFYFEIFDQQQESQPKS